MTKIVIVNAISVELNKISVNAPKAHLYQVSKIYSNLFREMFLMIFIQDDANILRIASAMKNKK